MITPGKIPIKKHNPASKAGPASIPLSFTSWAFSLFRERDCPKNISPNTFTKHAAANAAVNAKAAAATGIKLRNTPLSSTSTCNAVWKASHSETKPLNSGNEEILIQPTKNNMLVCGIFLIRPPIMSMFNSWVWWWMMPAPRNSKFLNKEWLKAWNRAARKPNAASCGWPFAIKIMDKPSTMKIMPMFSTEL